MNAAGPWRRPGVAVILAILVACCAGVSGLALAHARSVAYSNWSIDAQQASVELRITEIDHNLLRASRSDAEITSYLQAAVLLSSQARACTVIPGTFFSLRARPGWVRFTWRLRCVAPPTGVRVGLLFGIVTGHLHFTTFAGAGIVPGREFVLTDAHRQAQIPDVTAHLPAPSTVVTIERFAGIGVQHILSGWDHLVFLFALILLASSLPRLAVAVTGFTLGHSISLALGVLGLVTPNAPLVEALIGLSIALVAVENVWLSASVRDLRIPIVTVLAIAGAATASAVGAKGGATGDGVGAALSLAGIALFTACHFGLLARSRHPGRDRGVVAVLFGLIHGLAFAGALRELLPTAQGLAAPLFGFNLGVEIGQIAVLTVLWPVLRLARRTAPSYQHWIIQSGSAGALAVGLFWFVSRL